MPVGNAWGQTNRAGGNCKRQNAVRLNRSIAMANTDEAIGPVAPGREKVAKEHELVEIQQETHQEVQA
jgi:hypothetical protein